jgi:hypothetical protein
MPANCSGSQLFARGVRRFTVVSVPRPAPPELTCPAPNWFAPPRESPAPLCGELEGCALLAWLECDPPLLDDACAAPELPEPALCAPPLEPAAEPPPCGAPPPCEPPPDEPPPLLCACAGALGIKIAEKIRNAAEATNATSRDAFLMAASLLLTWTLRSATRLLRVAAALCASNRPARLPVVAFHRRPAACIFSATRAPNQLTRCLFMRGKCDPAPPSFVRIRPRLRLSFSLPIGRDVL